MKLSRQTLGEALLVARHGLLAEALRLRRAERERATETPVNLRRKAQAPTSFS